VFVAKMQADFDADKDLMVTVTSAIGVEMILDYKIDTS